MGHLLGGSVAVVMMVATVGAEVAPTPTSESAMEQVARSIERTINVGGYTGAKARVLGDDFMVVNLEFPPEARTAEVERETREVAEGFAAHIRYKFAILWKGWRGQMKVAEFLYSPLSGRVTKK